MDENTPLFKPIFLSRKSSKSASSSSGYAPLITPLSSSTNNNNLPKLIRSNNSSGYQSLQSSNSLIKKPRNFSTHIRRRLNIKMFLKNTGKECKVTKARLYQPTKLSKFLPPQALTKNLNISSSCEIWQNMMDKETIYHRDPNYLMRQIEINSEMRFILIDWMKEVRDAYNLDMETFYLAVDYLDRYLSVVTDVPIHNLQAIGTTCLFIASKLHEITPPHIDYFTNITDGACNTREVLIYESHILLKINWHLQPVTPYSWLKLFLQIYHNQYHQHTSTISTGEYKGPITRMRYFRAFENSHFSQNFLIKDKIHDHQLQKDILKSCICDAGSLRFSYGVIAASILRLTTDVKVDVFSITGYGSEEISSCIKWLKQLLPHSINLSNTYVLRDLTNIQKHDHIELKSFKNMTFFENEKEKENIPLTVI
ncbi:hypothetical protein HZS_3624 [Henneguya salminicola]|nr:hypothetical protein HZS_3624 [Henneguya salminicola]